MDDDPLIHWRQGDFARGVGGFLFAGPAEGDRHFDAEEMSENIVGLVAISQTCDIVRRTGGRNFIVVCPLVDVPDGELTAIRKGMRPYFVDLAHLGGKALPNYRKQPLTFLI